MTSQPPTPSAPSTRPRTTPRSRARRSGILLANLGTPDGYDYWSMRRYLNEFLSDRRVIDYAPWKWQPLLQLVILTKRPFTCGAAYKSIWNEDKGESPLMTITKRSDRRDARRADGAAMATRSWSISACATATPRPPPRSRNDRSGLHADPVLPALSAICRGHLRHRERPVLPRADEGNAPARRPHRAALFRPAGLYRRAGALGRGGLCRRRATPTSWSCPITACRSAT